MVPMKRYFAILIYLMGAIVATEVEGDIKGEDQPMEIMTTEGTEGKEVRWHREIENLSSRNLDSECTKNALEQLLSKCSLEGLESINPRMRKEVAIKLSKCEFDNSRVLYPEECWRLREPDDYDRCLSQLKKSPQYWTTFSGNYREINKICHEEALPYQKDQIIGLYSNVTKVVSKILVDLKNSASHSEASQEKLRNQFEELINKILDISAQHDEQKEKMKQEFKTYNEDFNVLVLNSLVILDGFSTSFDENLFEATNHVSYLTNQIRNLMEAYNEVGPSEKMHEMQDMMMNDFLVLSTETKRLVRNILSDIESTNFLTSEHHNAMNEMFRDNRVLSNSISNILVNTDSQIKSQNAMMRSEFEFSISHFSDFLDEQINGALSVTTGRLEELISSSMDHLDSKINLTEQKLDTMNNDIEKFSGRLNNLTIFIYDALSLITENSLFCAVSDGFSIISTGLGSLGSFIGGIGIRLFKFGIYIFLISLGIFWVMPFTLSKDSSKRSVSKNIQLWSVVYTLARYLRNMAIILSILSGALAAILVSRTMRTIRLYVENVQTSQVDSKSFNYI
ncbi:uncharacterized protein PRCAT00006291001 [Priceomyces carsonii]|uniref:uncharacterized protein n=1 Tax=Priceomyces carsonii TaxID=28549 RepID=UPI002EDBA882|nr:unnamed protein product [Priceomyces carsonii]